MTLDRGPREGGMPNISRPDSGPKNPRRSRVEKVEAILTDALRERALANAGERDSAPTVYDMAVQIAEALDGDPR